uniref:Gustatory receptor n=1 Tax=Clastoptera arizonana TaxID=38151 RepID=A0A1B6DUQ0_9HEMI
MCSAITLYSIVMMICLCFGTYSLITNDDLSEKLKETYDKIIKYCVRFILLCPQILSMIIVPLESRKIVSYMNHWRQFSVHFNNIIGCSLPFSLVNLIPTTIILSIITLVCTTFLESGNLLEGFSMMKIILYNGISIFPILLMLYWFFICLYITHIGKILSSSLVKILEMNPSSQQISDYRHLWLDLCDLTMELPSSMLMTTLVSFICNFVAFVFCCYGCFTELFQQHLINFLEFLLPLIMCTIIFVGYCDGAYKVKQKLSFEFLEAILLCKLLPLKESSRQEMELLIDTIQSNPPIMHLTGLFIISRNILVQIVSMSTTYMVVLLQFRISADEIIPDETLPAQPNISEVSLNE